MLKGISVLCCRATILGPQVFSPPPHKLYPWRKRQPSRFCRRFLNIFNIVSFKRNVLHSSSKEQRTELLTVALALTALASTHFPRKVSSQVLIGQSLRRKMREAASPAFQDLSVGAESHRPHLSCGCPPR